MSSTAVQTSAHSLGGRENSTMSQSYMSWTPDPYAPRDPAHRPYDQQGQALRLPPPASLVGVPPNHHDMAQSQQNIQQRPRHSYPYQDGYVPTASAHHPHAPPQQSIPPQFHPASFSPDHPRRRESDISQFSPTVQPVSRERFDSFPGHRVSQYSSERPAISPGSVSYRQGEHPAGLDARLSLPHTGQQPHPPIAPTQPQMLAHGGQYNTPRLGSDARPDPMKIADLVDGRRHSGGLEVEYKLNIRQQPVAARSCGFGERDRRVIDPPPIVQLIVQGPNLTEEDIASRLRYGHYVMSCSIYDESGTRDASFMPEEYRQQRRLMGSLVGAPFVGKDENEKEGCFFCFPDLSCRTPGAFRLKFSLVMIDPIRASKVRHFPVLVEAKSNVFTVYNAKDFPGMQASTKLTKRLKEQGCIISIKKGNDKARESKNSRGLEESSDEDGEQGKRKRRLARP